IVQEYAYNYGLKAIINRCGLLAGSWQIGKVDQGVISLWVSRHYFRKPLTYIGFGGEGKQVRDMLHIDDFFELIVEQTRSFNFWDGRVYNVGGGSQVSVSLMELTALCEDETGHRITIDSNPQTNPLDIRIFLTDARKVRQDFDWRPQRTPQDIVRDIHSWICENESMLSGVLNEGTSRQLVHI
ncbi:MAG: GDP-mannose 4,6-dehydratase, partial [Planctomycetes bacterium]|nr:GDP-mannose 4,6-dehydratase [Planctomycetota bacterium]